MTRPVRLYLWLAFGITWGVGLVALLTGEIQPGGATPLRPFHYIAAFGPSIAGVFMTWRVGRGAGLIALLRRVVPRGRSVHWYALALLGFPALCILGERFAAPETLATLPAPGRLLALIPITLVADTGPLGEEFGWRGFMLPKLLEVRSPRGAALLLGAIWWGWHLPTFFIPALSQHSLSVPLFLVNSVALSVIMTWLFQRTDGDLLLMIFVHVAANYTGAIGVPFGVEVAVEAAIAAVILGAGGLPRTRPSAQTLH